MPNIVRVGDMATPEIYDVALWFLRQRRKTLAVAWCDILDDRGELAPVAYCRALAMQLNTRLFLRCGSRAVDEAALKCYRSGAFLMADDGGIAIEQFA
mgnify:CR=1 FL=1